jgi:hypothetical protein
MARKLLVADLFRGAACVRAIMADAVPRRGRDAAAAGAETAAAGGRRSA